MASRNRMSEERDAYHRQIDAQIVAASQPKPLGPPVMLPPVNEPPPIHPITLQAMYDEASAKRAQSILGSVVVDPSPPPTYTPGGEPLAGQRPRVGGLHILERLTGEQIPAGQTILVEAPERLWWRHDRTLAYPAGAWMPQEARPYLLNEAELRQADS